jgi:hypothetical protein
MLASSIINSEMQFHVSEVTLGAAREEWVQHCAEEQEQLQRQHGVQQYPVHRITARVTKHYERLLVSKKKCPGCSPQTAH